MADFTGQNIQDTYQRVVQVDGGQLEDGTGSALPIKFIGDDVIVPGALRANSYIVSESITIVTSGSTEFGNSSDDTHTFIGNITASKVTPVDMSDYSGSILTVGKLIAKDTDQGASIALFDADGNSIASLARMGTGANAHRGRLVLRDNANQKAEIRAQGISYLNGTSAQLGIGTDTPTTALDVNGVINTNSRVVAAGDISSSAGEIVGNSLRTATGVIIGDNTQNTQLLVSGDITASGNISASVKVLANSIEGNTVRAFSGGFIGTLQTAAQPNITSVGTLSTLTTSGEIAIGGAMSASGQVFGLSYDIDGNPLADFSVNGLIISNNEQTPLILGRGNLTPISLSGPVTASGNISAGGNVTANNATINEGYVTVTGSSTSHGFELSRDGLDTYKIRHLDGGLTIQNSSDSRKEMTFDGTGKVGIGNNDPQEILTVEGNISSSGNIISTGTGSFGRLEATSDIALQLLNDQAIVFENAAGNEFSQIKMNTNDQLILQNLRSDKDVFIKAGSDGNEGNVIIQKGGSEDTIAKFGKTADLDLAGNFTASGNISANYIATAKIPLIQYISTDTTSTAQGRVLASGTHDNATDSFALEWDTPLFEDTDFFETGSVSPTTTGAINTFAVKQTGRYEINCNVTFRATAGARPGLNLGIFTSSAVNTVGDFRPKGPAAHAYVRVSGTALGSTAAIPGFVIQLTSGSAVSMKVDLKDDFGATGNTLWSGSLSHFNMKKIG